MLAERKGFQSTVLLPVFIPTIVVAFLLIVGTIAQPQAASDAFSATLSWITVHFGWFYMLAVAIFLVFIVVVAVSDWGKIRLGPEHSEPQYSFPAWFAMLFSAGYGIALLFFGVAEPVLHYSQPPQGAGETVDAARQAMQIAYFHWGVHIWAIYGLVGLVLAYFAYRHGLPLSIRSALYPLIGERIYGWPGHLVDVFAILGTMFGLATSLGLSVTQINAGLNYLWPSIPVSTTVQVIAIALITLAATASVVAGLDKGVKNLSILNMGLAVFLMLVVFLAGPTIHVLETFLQNTGAYLSGLVARTFNLQAYSRSDWIGNWTLFIFGWTIAWAPFVGLFIAKISRGRTIRQFVFGVLAVPTVFTFLWFSIFGDTALWMIMQQGVHSLVGDVQADHAVAIFAFYEHLPWSSFLSLITVFLIITFFVTSSDSGSLVIDSLASGGALVTPAWQRVFWATLEGLIAAVLLLAGGLNALQTMTIASALPFAIIMLIAMVGMWRALVIEGHRGSSLQSAQAQTRPNYRRTQWRNRLAGLVDFPDETRVNQFIQGPAQHALNEVQLELTRLGWHAETHADEEFGRVWLQVQRDEYVDFLYEIRRTSLPLPDFMALELKRELTADDQYFRAEVFLRPGSLGYDLYGCDAHEVIRDVLDQFENYLHFLHVSPGQLPWNLAEHDTMLQSEAPEAQGK
ncbi:BCCT family transporter [Venatoribacter cucullus]|uniref:BCCT family transporter n=1 Tax=Venatoribacter cucullus TaxID=2661630 RepID=A0A9X7UXH4_9GAMM|nr:BCCT family transporter [Venatoribacter cucullus]QQD22961.1 BCCT family transporter [Venatoribacter cucullus]